MVMGVSSVTPMIPMLAREFAVSHMQASLVLTFFTLPGILFALPVGILADSMGRKALLVPSFFLFGLAGTACAFASDFHTLLVLRVLQGAGAIALGVLNTTIIADTWSGETLPRMIGYNMAVLSVCTAVYPAIGGTLAYFNWRYAFILPILGIGAGFVALWTPLARPAAAAGVADRMKSVERILRDPKMLALFAMTFITFMMLYGPILTCFPLLADGAFHANSGAIGFAMVFSSAGTVLIALRLGFLSQRFSPAKVLCISQGAYALALLLLLFAPGLYWALPPLFLYGISQGLNIPVTQSLLLQAAPPSARASVMALNGMIQRIGQALAPVGFSAVAASFGIDWGFYAGMALAGLLTLIILRYIWKK